MLSPSTLPVKFDTDAPADPSAVSGYPSNPGANKPDFNADGSKVYVPNFALSSISVVSTSPNTLLQNIVLASNPVSVDRGTNGFMYVPTADNTTTVIDPGSDNIVTSFSTSCMSFAYLFSADPNHDFYYGFCANDGKILKLKVSDNSEVAAWSVGYAPIGGYLSLDNKNIFFFSTVFMSPSFSQDIVKIDTATGNVVDTIELSDGAVGFIASPDGQRLYVATPGESLSTQNIAIVNTITNTVTDIPLSETALAVTFPPATSADTDIKDVSVVLGVKTAAGGGSLAETGALAISVTLLLGLVLGSSVFVYYDYRRHKKPLAAENPNVHYTFLHHVRIVTIPLLKYRLSFQLETRTNDNILRKF